MTYLTIPLMLGIQVIARFMTKDERLLYSNSPLGQRG